jgi:membrane protease YdiL (CAAX protease family)
MSKPVLGLVLGGILGILDGLSALVSAPNDPAVKAGIVGIVIGSTIKGILTGALIGWYARRAASLTSVIVFGLGVGLALAFLVCMMQLMAGENAYYWQIMLPGGILGMIVGYATFRSPASTPARAAQSR